MYPEDRVLIGVINRKQDLAIAQHAHWYRVPWKQAARGIHAEYVAFYQSRAFGEDNKAIRLFARRTGHELVRRKDLLPDEVSHRRANELYFKIQLGELRPKVPPISNPTGRPVIFIYTTWDRFIAAEVISDLYSTADHFVDRTLAALVRTGLPVERLWEAAGVTDDGGAQLRIQCEGGELVATTSAAENERIQLSRDFQPDILADVVAEIQARIDALGGVKR
jgi:hypothetical protein